MEGEDKQEEIEFMFKTDVQNFTLRDEIINSYKKHRLNPNLAEIVTNIKKDLDENISKGWIVFCGKSLAGACCFIENTMLDFEVEGKSFVVFQTICPTE